MICRPSDRGQRLDVAGLNLIIVVVDRSETQRTEVGLNTWRRGLEGPPHSHDAKEQIFYVTAGTGWVVVGPVRYAVRPGSLVYVPPRVVHQTIVTGQSALTYLLFNAFLDPDKEGHRSFAEHIEKVKLLRKQQAASRRSDIAESNPAPAARPGRHIENIFDAAEFGPEGSASALLLQRAETCRSEVTLIRRYAGDRHEMVAHPEMEQTFFVLEGQGRMTAGAETAELRPGDVAFVPANTPCALEANGGELTCVCFGTFVV